MVKRRNLKGRRQYDRRYNKSLVKTYNRTMLSRRYTPSWSNQLYGKFENPFKPSKKLKLVYNQEGFDISTGATYRSHYLFNGNSIYDPNRTGVGNQPFFMDQYFGANGPYNQYTVLASKISIYVHTNSSELKSPVKVALIPLLGTVPPTDEEFTNLVQRPYVRYNLMDISKDTTEKCKVSNYCKTRNLAYLKGRLSEAYGALYNNSPAIPWIWCVHFSTQTTGITSSYRFDAKITYYVLAQSTNVNVTQS